MCQSVGDSLYWVYFVLRGGGIFTMRSVLFHCRAPTSDWHTITLFLIVNLMPPAFSEVFGVKLLHIFHPPFSWRRLMVEVEFICWEQQSFMWKYSALISSCSIDLWFNALHSLGADEIIFLNHGKYADLSEYLLQTWLPFVSCNVYNEYTRHLPPSHPHEASLGIMNLLSYWTLPRHVVEILSWGRKIFLHSCNFLFRLNKIDRLRESLMPRDHSTRVLCDYAINHCLICIL